MSTSEVVNQFLRLLGAQDAEGIGELFHDEIDWYVPGDPRLPWTGKRSRREDVPPYFRTLWGALTPNASVVDVEAILVDGDNAAVFSQFSHIALATGRRFDTPSALYIVVRDERIEKLHLYEDTGVVGAAFTMNP